ncbi:hypothetical protein AM493_18665 [Flavobacterium akiainvivens]|uniref:Uncharacterized protein n=1 Tax=Flavobacterium akiainvivens TaxID=1202724 RepID=A0A0M8MFJ8_9FLAO|nr:hypothetical protein [Flavobacterium akiainvivens]KOS07854.1 hypothetical protein AM493_18665 [Flavobacterium akiainvivens]SFQ27580.1 hypothetical protein SAMN05444144_102314 [Flavobacterium akiainvivens]
MEDNTNSRVGQQANRQPERNEFKKGPHQSYDNMPYEDPAITNPVELASYPPPAEKVSAADIENENEIHGINTKRNPVREGRNIISTDNNPERDGFM